MKTETKEELGTLTKIGALAGLGKVAFFAMLYGLIAILRHYHP